MASRLLSTRVRRLLHKGKFTAQYLRISTTCSQCCHHTLQSGGQQQQSGNLRHKEGNSPFTSWDHYNGTIRHQSKFHTSTSVSQRGPGGWDEPPIPHSHPGLEILRGSPEQMIKLRQHGMDIYNTAVNSVLPDSMVHRALEVNGNKLRVGNKTYELNHNVHIIAFGKAVAGMVRAAEQVLGKHIRGGIASVPTGIQETFKNLGKSDLLPLPNTSVKIMEGAKNNYPDENAHQAALEIYNLASSLGENDIALTLISGGGSTLLPVPHPPITMDELSQLTKLLSLHGATIQEMNTIRKHVELLKGGGLAKVAAPAQVISLILSDVIGDPLDFIASGPTYPDYSSPQQCLDLFNMLGIHDQVPQSIIKVLTEKQAVASAQVMADAEDDSNAMHGPRPSHDCSNAQNVIVGSNKIAARVAYEHAEKMGYIPYVLSTEIDGEARNIGLMYAKLADFICRSMGNKAGRDVTHLMQDEIGLIKLGITKGVVNNIRSLADDAVNRGKALCIIGSGETVVNVKGTGIGGRNQELVLAAALHMHESMYDDPVVMKNFQIHFLSSETDGQDGPCDAAGAMADPGLVARARKQNLDPKEFLEDNDSYNFFAQVDNGNNHIKTGLTGTNVMDLQILLVRPHLWSSYGR